MSSRWTVEGNPGCQVGSPPPVLLSALETRHHLHSSKIGEKFPQLKMEENVQLPVPTEPLEGLHNSLDEGGLVPIQPGQGGGRGCAAGTQMLTE